MMWDDFLRALALMLVFEGIMPFVAPRRWRNLVTMLEQTDDKTLRTIGLVSMLSGVAIIYVVNRGVV
jgi:uncharacterized protein YjeT (DUF2065 family)